MKTSYAALFLALSSVAALAQKPGDTVTPEALGQTEWFRGEAPKEWEPGKVYVIECWATWCGPCIAAIPHVDALYDKYQDKGLRVIGMNVFEKREGEPTDENELKEKARTFVKEKGDGMSYPVAFAARNAAFENTWLKPAGVNGIPHAFVVKEGKVVLATHPMNLKEETIEALIEGGEKQEAAIAAIKKEEEENQKKALATQEAFKAFQAASKTKDIAGMEKALGDILLIDEKSPYASIFKLEISAAKGDWADAQKQVEEVQGSPLAMMVLSQAARNALKGESPLGFRKVVAEGLERAMESNKQPFQMPLLARLQWSIDEKKQAAATAKAAAEEAHKTAEKNPKFPVMPFDRFAEALEKGEMPTEQNFNDWMREALPAAVPAAPVKPKEDAKPAEGAKPAPAGEAKPAEGAKPAEAAKAE